MIVPSLPGFAFSDAPPAPRGLRAIAGSLAKLVREHLGLSRVIVAGGDFGAVAGSWMAHDHPDLVAGLHQHMVFPRHEGGAFGGGAAADLTPEEKDYLDRSRARGEREGAYFKLHATKPDKLALLAAQGPLGVAAWILEKYAAWTDLRERALEDVYSLDELITNVMVYLVTESFETSIWPYAGFALEPGSLPGPIQVPVGVAAFPDPLSPVPPRSYCARSRPRIVHWTDFERGGHFPFQETPELYVADLRRFGRTVRLLEAGGSVAASPRPPLED